MKIRRKENGAYEKDTTTRDTCIVIVTAIAFAFLLSLIFGV